MTMMVTLAVVMAVVAMVIIMTIVPMIRGILMVLIVTIFFIHGGMGAPIGMPSFPVMEMAQPDRIHHHPYITGSKVIILVTHHANVFGPIPDITIRNHSHRYGGCGRYHYGSRRHHYRRTDLD